MNKIMKMFQSTTIIFMIAIVSIGAITMPIAVHAQFAGDGGCCDAGYTDYGYSDPGYTDYGYSDPGYTDYGYSNPGYTDYNYTDYGYAYDYGYTASPVYSYSSPTYGYSMPTYSHSTPHFYASPTPSYSYTTPTYVDHTVAPTWPTTTHVTATPVTVGTPSGQQQQQQTQYDPVTVTQNQAPITNTNNNIINIPAPVYQAPVQQIVQHQAPSCTISVSNSYYNSYNNNPVTLTWSSTNAYSASISPSIGVVNPNGSTTVYPTNGTTIYTLTVYGTGGSNTCQTQVLYQAQPIYHAPVVPHAPYVSLTQIPYTGFDFGPVGNAIYWASLLSFALAAAYLVLYYRGGIALTTGTTGHRRKIKHAHAHVATTKTAAAITPAIAPREATVANLPTREYRNATADTMVIAQAKTADEMPRIYINRA